MVISFSFRWKKTLRRSLEVCANRFICDVTEKVELAVQRMGEEMRRGEDSDCLKWWTFLATDVSGHLMFGESFRMLELGKVRTETASSRNPPPPLQTH